MTQPSGWYDDPQDPSQLRYWDGVVWSNHVTPRVSPTVEQSNIGMPYGVTPAAARTQAPGAYGAQGSPTAQSGSRPPQQGQGQQDSQTYGQPYGQYPGQQAGWQSNPNTTPDGVPLAGWWLRVLARFLDSLFAGILALPFTGWFYYQYIAGIGDWSQDVTRQAAAGAAPTLAFPPAEVLQFAFLGSIIGALVSVAYEVFFLNRSGATPGKKIAGISVRLRERPGLMPMKTILGRSLCYFGFNLISILSTLNVLWPLWDDKKQALHDKVVKTNVVLGPQVRREG